MRGLFAFWTRLCPADSFAASHSSPMPPFLAELLGTMLLIILGDGVVANVVLNKTKGQNAGWIVITAGWAFGVAVAVYAVGTFSGAHLNPAVTIGLASIDKLAWASVPVYVAAQMLGAFLGATIVWLAYLPHWPMTESPAAKNLNPAYGWDAGLGPFLVGILVWAIGLSLGGPTGYAINPARDLGPRIAHALLPIAGKGNSDWGYAWIPVAGPV